MAFALAMPLIPGRMIGAGPRSSKSEQNTSQKGCVRPTCCGGCSAVRQPYLWGVEQQRDLSLAGGRSGLAWEQRQDSCQQLTAHRDLDSLGHGPPHLAARSRCRC